MMWAYIARGIRKAPLYGLPPFGMRLNTNEIVYDLSTIAAQEACGFFVIRETPRPADTADTRYPDFTVQLVNGVPTQVWPPIAKTEEEKVAEAAAAIRSANLQVLTDLGTLITKMGDLETFFGDPDVLAANSQPNNTALTAQQQNRFNKAVITELRRLKNMEVRLIRALISTYQPSLLDTVSDT